MSPRQVVQNTHLRVDHFGWSTPVHTRVDHPLTCTNTTYRRLVQTKLWTTQNRPDFPCNPSGPDRSLLRKGALQPRARTPLPVVRRHQKPNNRWRNR